MGMITITCPRCKEKITIDTATVNAVCPSCQCKMLLKRRAVTKKAPEKEQKEPASAAAPAKQSEKNEPAVSKAPAAVQKKKPAASKPAQEKKPAAPAAPKPVKEEKPAVKRPPTLREDPPTETVSSSKKEEPETQMHTYMYPHYTARGEDALRQGDFLMQSGDYEHALNAFRRAATEMPDDYRSRWGVTTAMLHYLQHFLSTQYEAFNPIPLERVCNQQLQDAEAEMEVVRSLTPNDRIVMLEEAYAYEVHDVYRALAQAKKTCRRNLRRKHNYPLRIGLFAIALLLVATGILCAFLLPLELPGRLMIGAAAIAVGLLSAVLAFRI